MEQKVCIRCKKLQDITEYHKGYGKHGRINKCRTCYKELYEGDAEKREKRNKQKHWKRDYLRKHDPEYRKKDREYTVKNYRKHIVRYLVKSARRRAKEKGIIFDITTDHISLPELCPLLGIPMKMNENKRQPNSYSIDKIDNTKGYTPGNVWVISSKANLLKGDATIEELEMLVKNLRIKIEELKNASTGITNK